MCIENTAKGDNPGGKSRLLENLAREMKLKFLLLDDGDLQSKNIWKKAMQTYTGYLREEMEITPKLYYDIFFNLCDSQMQKKTQRYQRDKVNGRG